MKFVIASHNQDKIHELQRILRLRGHDCQGYSDLINHVRVPREGSRSYRENAEQKAVFISKKIPDQLVIADDSGLKLAAKPQLLGVRTARDLANYHTPHEYDQYLIRLVKKRSRDFKMQTTLACACHGRVIASVDGNLAGKISRNERGQNGEGFNRILIPEHRQQTLAEMPLTRQYYYLSRARAVDKLLWQLKDNYDNC